VGRFAPSPTGDLHLGSLLTAVASFLDARAAGGRWLVRMEDLDRPREVPGAAARILRTLETFGFEWDGPVLRQSDRLDAYRERIEQLRRDGRLYACTCSRRTQGADDHYPGTCRDLAREPGSDAALRLRVEPGTVCFSDRLQGMFRQDVATAVGDFVVQRRDGIFAYVLAVVVDDAHQGVTDVVRGADLLDNTPRQLYLQRQLGLPAPGYLHVPVLTEPDGAKLAKSARSIALDPVAAPQQLHRVLGLLGHPPPGAAGEMSLHDLWRWAKVRYDSRHLPRTLSVRLRT
jgi:glutamyl-Q tRNA(Asp) synthetase